MQLFSSFYWQFNDVSYYSPGKKTSANHVQPGGQCLQREVKTWRFFYSTISFCLHPVLSHGRPSCCTPSPIRMCKHPHSTQMLILKKRTSVTHCDSTTFSLRPDQNSLSMPLVMKSERRAQVLQYCQYLRMTHTCLPPQHLVTDGPTLFFSVPRGSSVTRCKVTNPTRKKSGGSDVTSRETRASVANAAARTKIEARFMFSDWDSATHEETNTHECERPLKLMMLSEAN